MQHEYTYGVMSTTWHHRLFQVWLLSTGCFKIEKKRIVINEHNISVWPGPLCMSPDATTALIHFLFNGQFKIVLLLTDQLTFLMLLVGKKQWTIHCLKFTPLNYVRPYTTTDSSTAFSHTH